MFSIWTYTPYITPEGTADLAYSDLSGDDVQQALDMLAEIYPDGTLLHIRLDSGTGNLETYIVNDSKPNRLMVD